MARPTADYQATKARVRKRVEDRLADIDPLSRSISLATIRRYAHQHGFDSYLEPVLREMVKEGVISILSEGKSGTIYVTGGDE